MSIENKNVVLVVDCGEDPNANTIFVENIFERMFDGSNSLYYSIERNERGTTDQDSYNVYKIVFRNMNNDLRKMCDSIKKNDGVIDYTYVMTGKTSDIYTWKIAEIEA